MPMSFFRGSVWSSTVLSALGLFALAHADSGLNDKGNRIAFFTPSDDRYPDFTEASFSVPRPVVVIDDLVFGNSADYPDATTIQQTGPDTIKLRIRGTVYDFLADMVADRRADIRQVRLAAAVTGWSREVGLTTTDAQDGHPLREYYDQKPAYETAVRPFPFAGRFDSGEIELKMHTGYNGITVTATNINDQSATSSVRITASVNREERRYDVTAEVNNIADFGLYNPVLVYINDSTVTPANIGSKYATVNGMRVGLRFIDGQLQLDRPIVGLNSDSPGDVPNLVNVVGDPSSFLIRYGDDDAVFTWGYTAMRRVESYLPSAAVRVDREYRVD